MINLKSIKLPIETKPKDYGNYLCIIKFNIFNSRIYEDRELGLYVRDYVCNIARQVNELDELYLIEHIKSASHDTMRGYLQTLNQEQLVDVANNLYENSTQLRQELDDALGVIR